MRLMKPFRSGVFSPIKDLLPHYFNRLTLVFKRESCASNMPLPLPAHIHRNQQQPLEEMDDAFLWPSSRVSSIPGMMQIINFFEALVFWGFCSTVKITIFWFSIKNASSFNWVNISFLNYLHFFVFIDFFASFTNSENFFWVIVGSSFQ